MVENICQNCTLYLLDPLLNTHDIEKLEKVQLSAARIVTGLPIFASRESLYTEKGWQTLQNRHYAAKMLAMFNIYNGYAPPYSI